MDDTGRLTALSNWMMVPAEHHVAFQVGETATALDFKHRVKEWFDLLSAREGDRWALYHDDSYEFVAILFALWQLNRTACVPGDNLPSTLERLNENVDGYIGHFPKGLALEETLYDQNEGVAGLEWTAVKRDYAALEIYTSGSTGNPKPITKTLAQLELEIETLEDQWPSQQDCLILSTVSHQHFYGMIFRLLWPLSAGQPFLRFSCEYIEDVFYAAQACPSYALISSPSHLARINTVVDWHKLKGQCCYVFSSAAPLLLDDSVNTAASLKTSVREIYGSSETGAIAWRMQNELGSDALWQSLPKVKLSAGQEGALVVSAPYLANSKAMQLADLVVFSPSNTFKLNGRVDEIVKVEGKRVSLLAIERLLLKSDWVKEVKALVLSRKRVETAAVIRLTELGERHFQVVGKKMLMNSLKNQLRNHFELVVIPRRWRFVEQMPYNTQGKLPMDALEKLFDKLPVKWPTIEDSESGASSVVLKCYVPADLMYFDGHFDDFPILPGVVQTYWAEKFGREMLSIDGCFKRLEAVKFSSIIHPDSRFTINLDYNNVKKTLLFKYESEGELYSSGRICFE
ncbi:MAG: AMP-binding protein [Cycloclasticus sp.]|nr:AMP-binding protein [Cycloclasticus sp.]